MKVAGHPNKASLDDYWTQLSLNLWTEVPFGSCGILSQTARDPGGVSFTCASDNKHVVFGPGCGPWSGLWTGSSPPQPWSRSPPESTDLRNTHRWKIFYVSPVFYQKRSSTLLEKKKNPRLDTLENITGKLLLLMFSSPPQFLPWRKVKARVSAQLPKLCEM